MFILWFEGLLLSLKGIWKCRNMNFCGCFVVFWRWIKLVYVLFIFNNFLCVFILMSCFFLRIVIMFVLWMLIRWCVMMIVDWFSIKILSVFWMFCFVFIFRVFVVLFSKRMCGFLRIVWVMVIWSFFLGVNSRLFLLICKFMIYRCICGFWCFFYIFF